MASKIVLSDTRRNFVGTISILLPLVVTVIV